MSWFLIVSLAWAQDESLFGCGNTVPLPGTPSALLMDQSRRTNQETYGVVASVGRTLLPQLENAEDFGLSFVMEQHVLAKALEVPATTAGCPDGLALAPVDLFSSNMGLAVKNGWFGAFYAVGLTGTNTSFNPTERLLADVMYPQSVVGCWFAAPALGAGGLASGSARYRLDYVAGLAFAPGPVRASVGYVGSRGLYVDLNEQTTRLFLHGAVQEGLDRLPFWAAGIARLPFPAEVRETAGDTKLFGRHLTWYLPGATGPGATLAGGGTAFTTVTAQQTDIRGIVDARVVAGVQPGTFVRELAVAGHSPGWWSAEEISLDDLGARVELGTIRVPPLAWYGQDGGQKLMLDASVRAGFVTVSARYNHPDVLDLFPYATDAFEFHLMMAAWTQ